MQPESIAMQLGSMLDLDFDRRSKARFPLRLSVRYRTLSGGPSLVGAGRTVNMSSSGLLISSKQAPVRAGARLQIIVDWPALLHGITPLQLIAVCTVTRRLPAEFAVEFDQYQFKTKKREFRSSQRNGSFLAAKENWSLVPAREEIPDPES